MEKEVKTLETVDKGISTLKRILLGFGGIVAALFGGYLWLEDTISQRNAEQISEAVIQKATQELNPVPLTLYLENRRKDSIERVNAELYALAFIHRQDSINLVLTAQAKAINRLLQSQKRIEAKIDADSQTTRDAQLQKIWQFLQEQQAADTTEEKILQALDQLKKQRKEQLENLKTGDRIE